MEIRVLADWKRRAEVDLGKLLVAFHEDESGGERDTLTTLLLLALIVIPLLFVIWQYGDAITTLLKEKYDEFIGEADGGFGAAP